MKIKLAYLVLAGAALVSSNNAWSWSMKGETVRLNSKERDYCEAASMDAASTMFSRQMGEPLEYLYPAHSDTHKMMRVQYIRMAQNFPIENSEEKKMAVGEKFSINIKKTCYMYLMASQPESSAE